MMGGMVLLIDVDIAKTVSGGVSWLFVSGSGLGMSDKLLAAK